MALNYVFIAFILIGFLAALYQFFLMGNHDIFALIMQGTFDHAKLGFELSIGLTGALALWMGLLKIGENGGAVRVLARLVNPFFNRLFPELPKDHPVFGSIMMNFSANMLGLDNAATPIGLKAMNQLQELNPQKEKASNSQIMFLVLNTSGLTLIPVSILTFRATQFYKQSEGLEGAIPGAFATDVFIPILLATFISTLVGIIGVSIVQRINLFNKVVLAYLGGAIALIVGTMYYFDHLTPAEVASQSSIVANFILFSIIAFFIALALRNKTNVYESFIDGAKGGFEVAIKIVPYLIGILVAIGIFRNCGALDFIQEAMRSFFNLFLSDTRFVDALPTAMMKPLSGSGARAMMVETMEAFPLTNVNGTTVESFPSFLSAIFQGSTETTFYVLAVYFGSVGIKNTRYALGLGLLADFAGILAAIFIAYLFYAH